MPPQSRIKIYPQFIAPSTTQVYDNKIKGFLYYVLIQLCP